MTGEPVIHKQVVRPDDEPIHIPGRVLSVGASHRTFIGIDINVWYLANTGESTHIVIVGTGQPLGDIPAGYTFFGTTETSSGLVWHVWKSAT